MSEIINRTYAGDDGKRRMFQFSPETWAAVDLLARARGLSWSEWVERVPDTGRNNRHSDVRDYVIKTLLVAKSWRKTVDDRADFNDSALLTFAKRLNDDELKADLGNEDTAIEAHIDYGGFVLRAGLREGENALWIENRRPGCKHVVIPIPAALVHRSPVVLPGAAA